MPGPNQGTIPNIRFSLLNFYHYVEGPPPTSGTYGSGQFQVRAQHPFQPPQMGVGGPPGPYTSVIGANIHQMGPQMGQDLENQVKSALSHAQSMTAAAMNGGNHAPQAANSSSSRNVEEGDSMNTDMANLSLNDSRPQIPIHFSPPTSDHQVGLNPADQMGSSIPSTSYLRPYLNAVQEGSHVNPNLAPHMNESDKDNHLAFPTEIRPYGSNINRPPPPASESTSPFNFSPSFSVGPNSNLMRQDHSVHRTNIGSFNENNDTVRDSYNDNSLVDTTGRHSGNVLFHDVPFVSNWSLMILSFDSTAESNRRLDPRVPEKRKKKKSGVKTSPDPDINQVDEEEALVDETDEQFSTAAESNVYSSEKSSYHFMFLIACS